MLFNSTFYGSVAEETLTDFDVINETLTLANTEYTINLPAGTKKVTIQARGNGILKFRRTSAGPYFTFHPGRAYDVTAIKGSATISFILETNNAGEIVEIIPWD